MIQQGVNPNVLNTHYSAPNSTHSNIEHLTLIIYKDEVGKPSLCAEATDTCERGFSGPGSQVDVLVDSLQ